MNTRIDYKTSLQGFPIDTVRELAQKQSHPDAPVELTLRAMNSNWLTQFFNPYEATTICVEQLKINPQHNFFHLALGMLEEDVAAQKRHLISAALCTEPCGKAISAQAAYQLAVLVYQPWDKDNLLSCKAFAEAQACFTLALLLKNKQAIDDFDKQGRYRSDEELKSVNNYIPTQLMIMTCLALKRFPLGRLPVSLQAQNDEFKKTVIDALKLTTFEDLNNKNSAIRSMLAYLFDRVPEFYFYYFNYCYQYGLIDKPYFVTLLKILEEFLPASLLRAKTLANHALVNLEKGQQSQAHYMLVPSHTLTQQQLKSAMPVAHDATQSTGFLPPNVTAFIPAPLDSYHYPLLTTTEAIQHTLQSSANPFMLFPSPQPTVVQTAAPSMPPVPALTPVYVAKQ